MLLGLVLLQEALDKKYWVVGFPKAGAIFLSLSMEDLHL